MLVLNRKQLPSGEQMLETRVSFNSANELEIYDYIMPTKWGESDTSVTPNDVMNFLRNVTGDITVRINSQGGEVGAALAMYNRLLEHQGKVTTIVDGYAFSSAGWLALAGSDRQITNGALFMMHNPYMYERIDSEKSAQNAAARWVAHRDSIVNIFTSRTPMKDTEVKDLMDKETYMSAQESVKQGLFNTVRDGRPDTKILNCLNIPAEALNKAIVERPELSEIRRRVLNIRRNSMG